MSNFLTGTSNAAYHADKTHLSSSGLKLLLKDPQQFYKEYILGERVHRQSAAFDEGTLVHSLILEPHLVASQYVVYPGPKRAGKAYHDWVANNSKPGQLVVTAAQMQRAKMLAAACNRSSEAKELLTGGTAEYSMVGQILGVPVKARADYINVTKRYIVDVKTSSKATGPELFAETIEMFAYDLSAYLYSAIASQTHPPLAKLFDFYWIVISKADAGVSVIRATIEDMRIGGAKVEQAVLTFKQCKQTGVWALPNPTPTETNEPVTKGARSMSVTFKTSKGTELPTMNLKGKPYLQVAHRFVALNDDVPRFVIRTEFPLLTDEQSVCRAEVMLLSEIGEAMKTATATKRETKKDFSDHTEKAETGAIGRALAMLGFGTQFATQDMEEGERLADAPVTPAKKPAAKPVAKASGDEF